MMDTSKVYDNGYSLSAELRFDCEAQVFDSFECAFYAVTPTCVRCGCRIVGYGIEAKGRFFCGAACAREYATAGQVSSDVGEVFGY
jgi:hypothetical protein